MEGYPGCAGVDRGAEDDGGQSPDAEARGTSGHVQLPAQGRHACGRDLQWCRRPDGKKVGDP